jgi:nicotinamide phosphoribosyltransferase
MTISSQRLMAFLEIYWTDVYKVGHKFMLPTGSYLMYSNFTPRSGKLSNVKNSKFVISAGQQKMVRAMKHDWDVNFFERPVEEIYQFGRDITEMLMLETPFDVSHFVALHELGYLPICVKAIPEGLKIPYKVPLFTVYNTHPVSNMVFDWLVNYLETIGSAESWLTPTSATTAYAYRQLGLEWAQKTDPENLWFVDYQFHDFSMRGMGGKSAIINSGLGFAMCSRGSDTLPVIPAARMYYDEEKPCINSVIATEHAIMCTLTGFYLKTEDGSWDNVGALEVETFRELLRRFPTGILSIVSDTWDLWRVITEYCRILKDEILARNGKLVLRPDSGDPVNIICGENIEVFETLARAKDDFEDDLRANTVHGESEFEIDNEKMVRVGDDYYLLTEDTEWNRYDKQYYFIENMTVRAKKMDYKPEYKGVIELLWDIFGGTITSKGYKKLDSHIGAIYGDSITLERAENIFNRLAAKGFASTNIVLGVGSYSLQYVTRDTHGFAQKATYVEIKFMNGHNETFIDGIEIFKDPATDVGKTKKSARGLIAVHEDENGELYIKDQCTWEEEKGGVMQVIFENGEFFNQTTLTEIRKRIGMAV